MLNQRIANVSLESFREHSSGKKVVLLYPWTNYRTMFLTNFLSNAREGLLYYRLRSNDLDLDTWITDLIEEFGRVLTGFGEHTRAALVTGDPEKLGTAFADDLRPYQAQPLILFIDEFDRLAMTDRASRFITALVNALPEHVQIALSSRMITYQPWNTLIEQGSAIVLGNQQRRSDLTFTVETQPKPQLEVIAFGKGTVLLNGREITQWEGLLPRQLFFYLVDHPLVTRDQIFADFWPALSVKDATDIFHVTKHKITEVIGRKMGGSRDCELTAYKQGFYIPSDKMVRHYDTENFTDAVERALQAPSEREAEPFLLRALDLYKAPFLEGNEAGWVVARRQALSQLYSEALVYMGRIETGRGEHEKALEHFTRALEQRPEREDIHRSVIGLLLTLGRRKDARAHYEALEQRLLDEFGIRPSAETTALLECRS
jgi:two-component SAPR family response regulator